MLTHCHTRPSKTAEEKSLQSIIRHCFLSYEFSVSFVTGGQKSFSFPFQMNVSSNCEQDISFDKIAIQIKFKQGFVL